MEERLDKIEEALAAIDKRNKRVELDKGWETSLCRRLIITVFTYAAAVLYLVLIGEQEALMLAIVPAGAYFISSLSLPIAKRLWAQKGLC